MGRPLKYLSDEARKEGHLEWRRSNRIPQMLATAKFRANKQGVPFSITEADLVIPQFCPILAIPLFPSEGKQGPRNNSPSLDKIVPSLGYVPGNVQVISHRANQIKSNARPEELIMMGQWAVRQLHGDA